MNENDNNFEALRRLMALKRHETPPPGYFNDFSGQVIARLRAGETSEPVLYGRLFNEAPWVASFLRFFGSKPAYVGAFSAAMCLLLLGSIVYNQRDDTLPESPLFSAAPGGPTSGSTASASAAAPSMAVATDAVGQSGGLAVTTNYSLQPVATMFGQQNFFSQSQQPVSFTPSGN
jgi:hypothetical protein